MKKFLSFIAALLFSVNLYAQPANNNCTTAQVVTPDGTCVSGTTVNATDGWNNTVGCQTGNNNSNHPDVWYSFTATGSQATFTVTAGTFTGNIELILVGGTCAGGLNLVGSQCGASPMNAVFNGLQSGTTYFYTISNTPTGTTGTFQSCVTTVNPPVASGQDCSTAAILCNAAVVTQSSSSAGFGTQEVTTSNSCWGIGGERQSRWYKFTVGCSGTLEFNINPVNGSNDYDWAIWNITGSPNTCTTKGNAIACNWSGCTGSTGLSSCRTSEPGVKNCQGNQQAYANSTAGNYNPINVIAGNTYTLLIDNFSTSNSGFTLTFGGACNGGTAVIGPDAGFSLASPSCGTYNFTKTCQTANSSFLWTFGDGNSSTQQNPSHSYTSSGGTYTITLQVTDALGCVKTSSQTVTIVSTAAPMVSSNSPLCPGATLNLTTNSVTGATYSWTGPNGFTSNVQNPVISNVTSSHAGTYSLVITIGGCVTSPGTATVTISGSTAPTSSFNSPLCVGQTLNLSTPTVSGATYSWTGPNGYTSTDQNPSIPNTNIGHQGTYSVSYIIGGCASNPGTLNVNFTPQDSATFAYSSGTYCQSGTTTPVISGVSGGAFSASPSGLTLNASTGEIDLSVSSPGTYNITYLTNGTCPNSSTESINISTAPSADFSYAGPYCLNAINPLPAFPAGSSAGAFSSTAGLVFEDINTGEINLSSSTAGVYTVTNTISVPGCPSTTFNFQVTLEQVPNLIVTNPAAVCSPSTVDITAPAVTSGSTGTGTLTYWTNAGATAVLNSPNAVNVSGTYYIQSMTSAGCSVIQPVNVTINQTPVLAITNPAAVCFPSTVDLTDPSVTSGSTGSGSLTYWT
ncbi:MAG: PKD domain-containing protein, partial [Bacteroidota bacterium]|nr:PKD domain-containing protein [Bacteroidota bacterium]